MLTATPRLRAATGIVKQNGPICLGLVQVGPVSPVGFKVPTLVPQTSQCELLPLPGDGPGNGTHSSGDRRTDSRGVALSAPGADPRLPAIPKDRRALDPRPS